MSLQDAVGRFAALPLRCKVLAFAAVVVLVELAFRRLAPKSRAYARWTAFFQAHRQGVDGGPPRDRLRRSRSARSAS